MSHFREEIKLIPRTAWVVASVFLAVVPAIAVFLFWQIFSEGHLNPGEWLIPALPFALIVLFFGIYILLIGYVYADARRRGMRYVMWTLLATFIPNAIGIILYFLLRDPLPQPCRACGKGHKPGLAFCPNCGAAASRRCPQCNCQVDEEWTNCAHCGVAISGSVRV